MPRVDVPDKLVCPLTREPLSDNFAVNVDRKDEVACFLDKHDVCTLAQFVEAVQQGSVHALENLNYVDTHLTYKGNDGFTLLHWAAHNGHVSVAKWLLNEKADVHAKTITGKTPLHLAAIHGHAGMVQLLLMKHAQVDSKDNGGLTSLHLAVQEGRESVVELLLREDAEIEIRDIQGNTPLHVGALCRDRGTVKVLLESWANTKAINSEGKTAEQLARAEGHVSMANFIREHSQQLKSECRRTQQEIAELKQIILQQQGEIQRLREQLKEKAADVDFQSYMPFRQKEGVTIHASF